MLFDRVLATHSSSVKGDDSFRDDYRPPEERSSVER